MRVAYLGGLAIVVSFFIACSLIHLDPVSAENRSITPIRDNSRKVTFIEPIVWMDAPVRRATRGVRLPKGSYSLEAEDHEYLYFKAPAPIEMRRLRNGVIIDGRDSPGGLALAKGLFNMIPAVAYIDVSESERMLVMKLGGEFMLMEGKRWRKEY